MTHKTMWTCDECKETFASNFRSMYENRSSSQINGDLHFCSTLHLLLYLTKKGKQVRNDNKTR